MASFVQPVLRMGDFPLCLFILLMSNTLPDVPFVENDHSHSNPSDPTGVTFSYKLDSRVFTHERKAPLFFPFSKRPSLLSFTFLTPSWETVPNGTRNSSKKVPQSLVYLVQRPLDRDVTESLPSSLLVIETLLLMYRITSFLTLQ